MVGLFCRFAEESAQWDIVVVIVSTGKNENGIILSSEWMMN